MPVAQQIHPSAAASAIVSLNRIWSADADQVLSFWRHVERYPAGANLEAGLRNSGGQAIVLRGWACEMGILPDGRRQIFSFALPGDLIDMRRASDLALRSFVALTRLELIDPRHLALAGQDGHAASEAGARSRQEAEDRLFLQMMRLGQLKASERMLHLLLELEERLTAVGLVKDGSFRLPLTQEVVADALGLSIVHVNRTLQQLRREKLITVNGRMITLHQRSRLSGLASYPGRSSPEAVLPC